MKKTIEKIPKALPVFLLFVFCSFAALAQNAITGTITDSKTGTPVQGVTVTIKGTKTSTQTAADGTFRISAPSTSATLVISSVGFATQEVSASTAKAVTVSVVEKNQQLNEVVVVGYGTARKKDLTGAVTVVNSKDFVKGSITTPEQLIAGKVAGVSVVSNSGQPGAGSTIRIRGGASLTASNDPLIVVDGVPLDNGGLPGAANPLALINPNDIETFTVLKDASAAAIYGSRASNGVILITTKKGGPGKAKVNFNTNISFGTVADKVDVMSPDEFRGYVNQYGTSDEKARMGTASTNWQDEIYQTAISNDNNLSVSGTSKNMPYRFSVGFLDQQGVLKGDKLNRMSVGLNLSPRLLKNNLKIDLNIKASQTNSTFANQGAIGSAVTYDPTQPITTDSKRFNGYYEWLDPASQTGLRALAPRNPIALLTEDDNRGTVKRSIGNIVFDYKFPFLPALRANLNLGYDIANGSGSNYINDSAASNYKRFKDPGGIYHGGVSSEYKQKRENTVMEFYLGYNKAFNDIRSTLDVIAGYSYNNFLTKVYNFPDRTRDKTIVSVPKYENDFPEFTMISFYGRLNYSLMNRYFITATIRQDGSSRFNSDNRWGTFPSIAASWRLKEENFMKDSKTFSDLKLRFGYGETGQQDGIGLYDYASFYSLGNNAALYQLGTVFFDINKPSAYYPNRRWEQTATTNIGLDFGLFENRVSGSVEVYKKKTTDLLNEIVQPAGTNFSNKIVANVGNMENKGVEATLNFDIIRKQDFTWSVSVNGAYNENKITKLTISEDPKFQGNQVGGISIGTGTTLFINTVGFPRNAFYMYKQIYDANGKPIDGLFEDINRDGKITTADQYRYKRPDPEAFFGFSTNFNYKRLNGGFVMRAQIGNYVYNQVKAGLGSQSALFGTGYLNNEHADLLNTNISGDQPSYYLSDYYVQNASFLKMDNLNIGYNIGKICKKGNANLRLLFSVQNVFTVTEYDGLDPEIPGGVDNNFYPRPRTYLLGLNLDF